MKLGQITKQNVQFQKIPILSHGRFSVLHPPPLAPGNSSLVSYVAFKNLAFQTPLPIEISNDFKWGGYGFFLELENALFLVLILILHSVHSWKLSQSPFWRKILTLKSGLKILLTNKSLKTRLLIETSKMDYTKLKITNNRHEPLFRETSHQLIDS